MTSRLRTRGPTLLAIAAWLALGLIDFQTGFVAYSNLRLLILIGLIILLCPLRVRWRCKGIWRRRPPRGPSAFSSC